MWSKTFAPKIQALILLIFWAIWLERHARVFRAQAKPVAFVLDVIMLEAERWDIVDLL
jgi:hypothetical protein